VAKTKDVKKLSEKFEKEAELFFKQQKEEQKKRKKQLMNNHILLDADRQATEADKIFSKIYDYNPEDKDKKFNLINPFIQSKIVNY
jgi:hypothetical protein